MRPLGQGLICSLIIFCKSAGNEVPDKGEPRLCFNFAVHAYVIRYKGFSERRIGPLHEKRSHSAYARNSVDTDHPAHAGSHGRPSGRLSFANSASEKRPSAVWSGPSLFFADAQRFSYAILLIYARCIIEFHRQNERVFQYVWVITRWWWVFLCSDREISLHTFGKFHICSQTWENLSLHVRSAKTSDLTAHARSLIWCLHCPHEETLDPALPISRWGTLFWVCLGRACLKVTFSNVAVHFSKHLICFP